MEKDGDWESDEENLERMHLILSSKNWSNELASDCWPGVSGDGLEGLREVLNSKFPKVCEGWRMIQLQVAIVSVIREIMQSEASNFNQTIFKFWASKIISHKCLNHTQVTR